MAHDTQAPPRRQFRMLENLHAFEKKKIAFFSHEIYDEFYKNNFFNFNFIFFAKIIIINFFIKVWWCS